MQTFLGIDYPTLWYLVIGLLFSGYAILEGFDFGAGAWHLFLRKDLSRRIAINAIANEINSIHRRTAGDTDSSKSVTLTKSPLRKLYAIPKNAADAHNQATTSLIHDTRQSN